MNVPISCGEIHINPGDIILGDPDGVIAIPVKDAEAILQEAIIYHEKDEKKVLASRNGTADRSWVGKLLEKKEIEIIDSKWYE